MYTIHSPCINTYAQISFLYVKYFTQTVYDISFIFAVDNAIAYVIKSILNVNAHIWDIYIYTHTYIDMSVCVCVWVCVCVCVCVCVGGWVCVCDYGGMYVHLRMDVTM